MKEGGLKEIKKKEFGNPKRRKSGLFWLRDKKNLEESRKKKKEKRGQPNNPRHLKSMPGRHTSCGNMKIPCHPYAKKRRLGIPYSYFALHNCGEKERKVNVQFYKRDVAGETRYKVANWRIASIRRART
jgi:hypothetical protein